MPTLLSITGSQVFVLAVELPPVTAEFTSWSILMNKTVPPKWCVMVSGLNRAYAFGDLRWSILIKSVKETWQNATLQQWSLPDWTICSIDIGHWPLNLVTLSGCKVFICRKLLEKCQWQKELFMFNVIKLVVCGLLFKVIPKEIQDFNFSPRHDLNMIIHTRYYILIKILISCEFFICKFLFFSIGFGQLVILSDIGLHLMLSNPEYIPIYYYTCWSHKTSSANPFKSWWKSGLWLVVNSECCHLSTGWRPLLCWWVQSMVANCHDDLW